jgi:protein required for attachment to host cells
MPTKTVTTWILVADGAKARLLEREGLNAPLTPASDKCFSESEARAPARDIGTDRPGRVHESADTTRHAMAPRVDWHQFAKEQFAKSVAGALEEAALEKRYDELVLIAPPETLGNLRGALGQHARTLVAGEVAKDLTNLPDHEISAHLA